MALIAQWYTHRFEMSASAVRLFSDLGMSATCDTEETESGSEKYVKYKSGKPAELSLTIHLNAALGCDVKTEAMALVYEAQNGATDYFYAGGGKLAGCQFILASVKVSKIAINAGGIWTSAEAACTFKQASKADGSMGSSSGSNGSLGNGGGGRTQYGTPWQGVIGTNSVFAKYAEDKASSELAGAAKAIASGNTTAYAAKNSTNATAIKVVQAAINKEAKKAAGQVTNALGTTHKVYTSSAGQAALQQMATKKATAEVTGFLASSQQKKSNSSSNKNSSSKPSPSSSSNKIKNIKNASGSSAASSISSAVKKPAASNKLALKQ